MIETAIFGGGCFWCTEAVFLQIKGVAKVEPGYAGGTTPNPTYEQVSSGRTGHIEVARIEYDPATVTYSDLLNVFFAVHDPTSVDRQGNDVGSQYRSAIFYVSPEQLSSAKARIAKINSQNIFDKPIVTELKPLDAFYPAENYHRDFFANNPDYPYCRVVIAPKLAKLRAQLSGLMQK